MKKDEKEESKSDRKEDFKDEDEGGEPDLGPPTLVAQKEDYDSSATVSLSSFILSRENILWHVGISLYILVAIVLLSVCPLPLIPGMLCFPFPFVL